MHLLFAKYFRLIALKIRGNRLTCTFWDEHVAKIEPFYQSPGNEPLYVLIQFCRLKFGVRGK